MPAVPGDSDETMNVYLPAPWDDGLVHLLHRNPARNNAVRFKAACQQVYLDLSATWKRYKETTEPVNCMRCMLYSPNQGA